METNKNEENKSTKDQVEGKRPISCPPEDFLSLSPKTDCTPEQAQILMSEEYYNYYYSLKPRDPRLPKPLFKHQFAAQLQGLQIIQSAGKKEEQKEEKNQKNQGQTQAKKNFQDDDDFQEMQQLQSEIDSKLNIEWNDTTEQKIQQKANQQQQQQQQQPQFTGNQPMQMPKFSQTYVNPSQQLQSYPNQPLENIQKMPQQQQQVKKFPKIQENPMTQMNNYWANQINMNPVNQNQYFQMNPMMAGNPMMQNPPMVNDFNAPYQQQTNFRQMQGYPQQQYYQNMYQMPQINQNMHQMYGLQGMQPQQYQNPKPVQQQREKLDLATVKQDLLFYCKDQYGSRIIQQYFEMSTENEKEDIWNEIKPQASNLITDVFGNYVIQKVLEKGTNNIRLQVFKVIENQILTQAYHNYGCRVIQKLLEVSQENPEIKKKILDEIKPNVPQLIEDSNGNHVIQKCFELIEPSKLDFIIDSIYSTLDKLAFNPYGCKVIQKVLEFSASEKKQLIMNYLLSRTRDLCSCQYGNYLMQYLLEKGSPQEQNYILQELKKYFMELGTNKFASNVVEKAVKLGNLVFNSQVISQLIMSVVQVDVVYDQSLAVIPQLFYMIKNQFGNYVIQRLFEYSLPEDKQKMYVAIFNSDINLLNDSRKSNYAKHVLNFIEKFYKDQQLKI